MTSNEIHFFRNRVLLDDFRASVIPRLLRTRANRQGIKIWCIDGSTGQEPYSLAICLKEMGASLSGIHIEILATDLSHEAIEKSKAGRYSQFEVQRGLPIAMLVKYFTRVGDSWQVNPDIHTMVRHQQLNLLNDFSPLGTFDVIFCRDSLTYFDVSARISIINRLAEATEPDGFLALTATETIAGMSDVFIPLTNSRDFHQPKTPPASMAADVTGRGSRSQ